MAKSDKTWFKAAKKSDAVANISIFADIGDWGVTAQDFATDVQALGDVEEIRLAISSNGGDVSVGTAIYNILERHPAHKVVTIEGLAASMASVIAMAGDEIVMPENAMMMIHNPWGGVQGEAEQVKSFGEALAMMQDNIASAYVKRTGLSESKILAMMEKESWLSAKMAVELGFADRIGDARDFNARAFNTANFKRTPKLFRAATKGAAMAKDKTSESESDTGSTKSAKDMRAEIVKANAEVRSMCALAGLPELADGYIAEDLSVSQVVNKLAEAKAEAAKADTGKGKGKTGSTEVSAHNRGGTDSKPVATIDPNAIYGRWNKRK